MPEVFWTVAYVAALLTSSVARSIGDILAGRPPQ